MDILGITSLVLKGVSRLIEIIPLWMGAKTPEERAALHASTLKAVEALDPHFAEKDASDKAARDALQAEIDASRAADTQP